MDYDFKSSNWKHDIHSFDRWKVLLLRIVHKDGEFYDDRKDRLRRYLRSIQQRWPQFIKEDEIP